MTSLDGEYMLLGRKSADTTNIFVQYGQGATRTVNATGGSGIQEAEFIDGLRFTMQSTMPFSMNVDLRNGVEEASLPRDAVALSEFQKDTDNVGFHLNATADSFSWVVNTTIPAGGTPIVDMRVPCKLNTHGIL